MYKINLIRRMMTAIEGRTRKATILVFCCLVILVLNSCLQPTPIADSTTTPFSSLMLISTLNAYPTPISVVEYPDQVTDGKVLFSVEKITDSCHLAGDPIELKFIFKNLTDNSIKIPSGFSIAANRHGDGGNILPFITSTNGADIYSYADVIVFDIFWGPSKDYLTISENQESEIVLSYKFPKYITYSPLISENNLVTPSPSRYFLRFVYLGHEWDINAWSGAIGSNRIEICIVN